MFKSILASLTGFPSDNAVLESAFLVANEFQAHVDCLHVTLGVAEVDVASTFEASFLSARTVEQVRAMERRIADNAARAQKAFDEIRARRNLVVRESPDIISSAATFAYREIIGSDLDLTTEEARIHDLTIIARDSRNVIIEPDRAGTVMLGSGRPILVPPRKAAKTIGTKIVIAWKNNAEAARACAAAMPFIAKATEVTVLAVKEGTDAEEYARPAKALARALAWHGKKVEAKLLEFSLKPAAETMLDEAYRLDADLLVMGGYGHSRFREVVFGGMTREVLSECEIPALLAH